MQHSTQSKIEVEVEVGVETRSSYVIAMCPILVMITTGSLLDLRKCEIVTILPLTLQYFCQNCTL